MASPTSDSATVDDVSSSQAGASSSVPLPVIGIPLVVGSFAHGAAATVASSGITAASAGVATSPDGVDPSSIGASSGEGQSFWGD